MYESASTFFSSYSQAGDILVIAMCLTFAVLIHASFVSRTHSFHIFCLILVTTAVAAYTNITFFVLTKSPNAASWQLAILRVLHYSAMYVGLFLYVLYIAEIVRLNAREKRRYLIVGGAGLAALILYMVLVLELGLDRYASVEGRALLGTRAFVLGYFFFMGMVLYIAIRYRGRVYKQVLNGILASSAIAFVLLVLQSLFGQISYTVAAFLFPSVALLYLIHANPYDLEIGAVNVSGFEEYVGFHRRHGRQVLLMSLLLPDFDSSDKKYPVDIQSNIRHFTSHYFRRAVLFQVSNGRMILASEIDKNPDYERTVRRVLDTFASIHEAYLLDYKIVISPTLKRDEEGENFNYIDFIQYAEGRMPVNTIHRVPSEEIEDYRIHRYILSELGDINARQDLNDERIQVYCQPVLNLQTGKYDTAEALMRLKLDQAGLVTPNRFIALAEEHNYITALSMIILSKTCAQIRRMLDDGYQIRRVSINFSMIDLRNPDFSERVRDIIRRNGIPCDKIAIELTESQNERDFMLVKERISELRESGIKFYLDDFGTGYSNFDRIMQLPFDTIKFDRSLVIASGTDEEKQTMVSYLAKMFRDMHYSVLYEGVETDSDQVRCADMCAEYLQGYKFSPPIPMENLREYFEQAAPVGT